MHPLLAIRAFFAVLFGRITETRIRECLDNKPAQIAAPATNEKTVESAKLPKSTIVSKAKPAMRNEALTLISLANRSTNTTTHKSVLRQGTFCAIPRKHSNACSVLNHWSKPRRARRSRFPMTHPLSGGELSEKTLLSRERSAILAGKRPD